MTYRKDNMLRIGDFRIIRSSPPVSFPPLGDLFRDDRFPAAAKIKIALVRALVQSTRRVLGTRKRIRYRSFGSIEGEIRFALWAARLMGLPLAGLGYYQKFDLIKDAARFMGLSLSTSVPPEGARYVIETTFKASHIPNRISLVWEDAGEPLKISVNGRQVTSPGEKYFLWDRKNRRVSIPNYLRLGTNRVRITSRQPSFPTMVPALHWVEPLVILGDFYVDGGVITPRRQATRHLSWGRPGTGNYSGTVTYRCRFALPKRYAGKRGVLDLTEVNESARVTLNGHDLGVRLWPPYRFELTGRLSAGENIIEISVSNTAENLLGNPIPSGIMTDPKIVFYESK
jgi:hypothetical protein